MARLVDHSNEWWTDTVWLLRSISVHISAKITHLRC